MKETNGMIIFCSKEDVLNELKKESFDKKYCITLFTNKGLYPEFIQRKDLAPSLELYNKTFKRWKKMKFTSEEWMILKNGKTHTWFDLYEEKFLEEMESRIDMKKALNEICEDLKENKKIICYCYCDNVNFCHRKILANFFKTKNFNVILK